MIVNKSIQCTLLCVKNHTLTFSKTKDYEICKWMVLSLNEIMSIKEKMQPYLSICLVHISFNIKCLNNCQHIKWIEIRSKTS